VLNIGLQLLLYILIRLKESGGNLDLPELDLTKALLMRRGLLQVIEDIFVRESDCAIVITVSSDSIEKEAGKGKVTIKQLDRLKVDAMKELSVNLRIVTFKGPVQEAMEIGLQQLFDRRFENTVCNWLLTKTDADSADVHIELQGAPEDPFASPVEEMKRTINEYLSVFGLSKITYEFVESEKKIASPIRILLAIKKLAPTSIDLLNQELERNYIVHSSKWLKAELDKLRKHRLLIWQLGETYVLTEEGLVVTPHSTSKFSSDIDRSLFLARKKW